MYEADAFGPAGLRYAAFAAWKSLPATTQLADEHVRSDLNRALAAQRAGLPEAAVLLERFIDRYSPQPIAVEAIKIIADNAFAERDYDRAAEYYDRFGRG